MKRWFRDTLFLRLFLLMWAALVISHIAAFGAVTGFWLLGGHTAAADGSVPRLPTFPSLPPTPGVPQVRNDPAMDGSRRGGPSGRPPATGSDSGGLPLQMLLLDYGIRILLIGVAAALSARWLATPVRRLVDAAGSLGRSLGHDPGPSPLDERSGTVEVREAARVFNRMARELDAQFRSRTLVMAALSHDLKTPLTRIRMRLEADAAAGPATEKSIADIREMSALVDSALDVFRASGHEEPVQAIDIAALLQSMVDDRVEAGQAVSIATAPAVALARPVALRRVVANLLDNALRYGGETAVSVGREGSSVRVSIDDRGPGIPPQLLDAVFQPFFRVDPSRQRSTGGSGLGLYIARDLTEKQGGTLVLANRPEGGLRAMLALPAAAAA